MSKCPRTIAISGLSGLPRQERLELMLLLELRFPDLRWGSGDTPTGFLGFHDSDVVGYYESISNQHVEHGRLWCYDWGTWSHYFPGFTPTPYRHLKPTRT